MYSNYDPNCCYYTNFCCSNNYCNLPAPDCRPIVCNCCPICRKRNKRLSTSTKSKIEMQSKMNSINGTYSNKPTSTRPKKNSAKSKLGSEKKATTNIMERKGTSLGSERRFPVVHSSLSESFVLGKSKDSLRNFKSAASMCQSAENCTEKGNLDFLFLIHKDHGQNLSLQKNTSSNHLASSHSTKTVKSQDKCSRSMSNTKLKSNDPSGAPSKSYCKSCNKVSLSKCSKKRSQLDVINEEEQDDSKTKSVPKMPVKECCSSSFPSKKQKLLEDSCIDFLNIVCDNILESVQKSVDSKLKEYSDQATKNLEDLGEKLARNESAMRDLCIEMMKTMNEQNKINFEKFYSGVQNLVENQSKNQLKNNITPDTENQHGKQFIPQVLASEVNILEQFSSTAHGKTACDDDTSETKAISCGCFHCFSNSNIEESFDHPCSRKFRETKPTHPCDDARESGGYTNCEIKSPSKQELKLQPCTTTFTTFGLTSSGRKIFNCCTNKPKEDGGRTQARMTILVNNNLAIASDSYDTSGYTTAPEDMDGIQQLQKKAFHSPTSGTNVSNMNNAEHRQHRLAQTISSQTIKSLEKCSSRSSIASTT